MPRASSAFYRLAYVAEATAGTTPANPVFKTLRKTGSALAPNNRFIRSPEITNFGRTTDITPVGQEPGGSIPVAWSAETLLDFLAAVSRAEWTATPERQGATEVSAVALSGVYTVTSGTDFQVGHLVKATNFATAANNGVGQVTATGATSVTLSGITTAAETVTGDDARLKVIGYQAEAAGEISVVVSGSTATFTSTLNPVTMGLAAGMWMQATGFTGTTANNGWYRISEVTASTIVCDVIPDGAATDAAGSVEVALYFNDYLRDANVLTTFTIEGANTDLDPVVYQYFRGCGIGAMSLDLAVNEVATGTVEITGLTAPDPTTTRLTGATTQVATTTGVFNAASHVGRIAENGVTIPTVCSRVGITLTNNITRAGAVGTYGAIDLSQRGINAQVTMAAYMEDEALLTRAVSGEETSFDLRLVLDGNGYIFDFPRGKYEEGGSQENSGDEITNLPLTFTAMEHTYADDTTALFHLQRVESNTAS